jgi:hypothetical protein
LSMRDGWFGRPDDGNRCTGNRGRGMPFCADRDGFCKIDRWDAGCAFPETDPFARSYFAPSPG